MKRILAIAGVFAILASPAALSASLGSDSASVEADRAKLQGTLETTTHESFAVHQIQAATGVTVREYMSPAGKIFAVTWQGPFHPDLQQVLGSYYDQYMQAAKSQLAARHGRGPVLIQQNGLVVEIAGHLRSFSGRAYVQQMLPSDVSLKDIK
jgi:hypothetical protein